MRRPYSYEDLSEDEYAYRRPRHYGRRHRALRRHIKEREYLSEPSSDSSISSLSSSSSSSSFSSSSLYSSSSTESMPYRGRRRYDYSRSMSGSEQRYYRQAPIMKPVAAPQLRKIEPEQAFVPELPPAKPLKKEKRRRAHVREDEFLRYEEANQERL